MLAADADMRMRMLVCHADAAANAPVAARSRSRKLSFQEALAAAQTLDFIIDTISAPHSIEDYLQLLKVDGKLVIVGIPPHKMQIAPNVLIFARRTLGGSLIGGLAETQEMLDFCRKHNVVCAIEKIPISYVNEAMVRLYNSDVHYRFGIDIENTLKA